MDNQLAVFEQKAIRQIAHNGDIYFSIVDIIEVLTGSSKPSNYWDSLKRRDKQLSRHCIKLKFKALDGKSRPSECVNLKEALIIIMSIPSPKAYSLKMWLAEAGEEKLNKQLTNSNNLPTLVSNHSQNNNSVPICERKTYLMYDTFRGYYKIGKSKDPKIREATLQAEVPTIELLHVIERDIETYLHNKFKAKRIRGEWFNLSKADVNYIKSY
jgi:prophage antirepressor-like protein